MNNKKGISLISLGVMIIVMMIIASTAIFISADAANNSKLAAFATDLNQMEDLVDEYYLTNNALPIAVGATQHDKSWLLEQLTNGKDVLSNEIDANGDEEDKFYKIDLSMLPIENLSRGIEKKSNELDIYVVALNSLNVYYLKGEKIANEYYFSLTESLAGKTKIKRNKEIDTSEIEITGTTKSIKLTKSTNNWTNALKVNVETELGDGETLKYFIANQDVTSSIVDNSINVSQILLGDEILKGTFYGNDDNKVVKVQKEKGGEVVAEGTVNISKLDLLSGNVITQSQITVTKYDLFNLVNAGSYTDLGGSGVKEARVLYTKKVNEDGSIANYYNDTPATITSEYVYNSGKISSYMAIKLPTDVQEFIVVFVDNAGNISEPMIFTIGE